MRKVFLIMLLILSRIADLYTTFLCNRSLSNETAPIVSCWSGHWKALIVDNVVVIIAFILLFVFFGNIHHIENKERNIINKMDFWEYLKFLYCLEYPVKNIFKAKSDYKTIFSVLFFLLPWVIITASFMACISNLYLFFGGTTFIQHFSARLVIYIIMIALIFIILIFHVMFLYKRYKKAYV